MKIFIEPEFTKYYAQYPLVLADIGASGGLELNWRFAKKYLSIIGFEPDTREFFNLKKRENSNTKYLNIGLHSKKTSLNYYLTRKQQVSSMFKPNREVLNKFPEAARFEILEEVTIETDTLDSQVKINNISGVDFIKADTQGSELFILQGAQQTMKKHVFGLEIEVEFVDIYKDQPLFWEVDNFIKQHGFELFDIQCSYWKREKGKDYHKKRGQLIFGNALYLKNVGDFKEVIDGISDIPEKKSKILKAISICFLYGYFDYAREIFDMFLKCFNTREQCFIEKTLKYSRRMEGLIPNFKGRGKVANMVYSLWEAVRPSHDGWSVTDRKLGNL